MRLAFFFFDMGADYPSLCSYLEQKSWILKCSSVSTAAANLMKQLFHLQGREGFFFGGGDSLLLFHVPTNLFGILVKSGGI